MSELIINDIFNLLVTGISLIGWIISTNILKINIDGR